MILFRHAQNSIIDTAKTLCLSTETVAVSDIDGRVCAVEVVAPRHIQPFDNAAMDGFAVRSADVRGASPENPVVLRQIGTVRAGLVDMPPTVQSGQCVHIMTGACMVAGADAVVPVEYTRRHGDSIYVTMCASKHAHIRYAGEDFRQGTGILKQGDMLTTAHILPLVSLGIGTVQVFQKPKISLITSGDELVNTAHTPLQKGQIYNANAPYMRAMLHRQGAQIVHNDTLKDNVDAFVATVQKSIADGVHMIVSSGAVSAGTSDFVTAGLQRLGADIVYDKLQMRPGKPNVFARLPNGALYFGLPGNPAATAVGVRFLVNTALATMTKRIPETPISAISTTAFDKKHDFCMFLKGVYTPRADGTIAVDIMDKQASFMVSPFLHMNCWVHMGEYCHKLHAGDKVDIFPVFVG